MMTMIRLGLFVAFLGTQATAFVPCHTARVPTTSLLAVDDPLWEDLKHKERDIVVQSVLENQDLDMVTKTLVEKLLEAALEHVKTQEDIEQEHVESAREAFDHALQEEKVLEEFVQEDQLKDIPMDSYLEGRWHKAVMEEFQAMEQDQKAIDKYDEWKQSEEDIRATLEALKNFKP